MPDVLSFRLKVPGESRFDATGVRDSSVRIHGLARLEGNTLHLEWSGIITTDEVGKVTGTRIETLPITTARIPLASIAGVEYRRGWVRGPRLLLRAADLSVFSDIPGVRDGVLVLRLRRRDRSLGQVMALNLELGLAETALLEAEQGTPPGKELKAFLLPLGLATLAMVPAAAQMPPIGAIDFYGARTVPVERLRGSLTVKVGDSLSEDVRRAVQQLEAIPGVQRAIVDAVCCEEGRFTLYVGIEEEGTPAPVFRTAPTGLVELSSEILGIYSQYQTAFDEAVAAGDFAEDDSQGHSLMHYPAARAAQEKFVELASRYGTELVRVLRESANQDHRAIAAQVLAYAPDKRAIVEPLVYATRDPHPTVRNNAVRALALLAGFARRYPDRHIVVPAEPLVDLLNSLVWTDRNKSSLALMQISEARDPALLALLKDRALSSLVEMARWKAPGHAAPSLFILGRLGGMPDEAIFSAFEQGRREAIIQAATR